MPSVDPEPPSLSLLLEVDDDAFADSAPRFRPDHAFLLDWAQRALCALPAENRLGSPGELSIRLVGRTAMQALNRDWRERDTPTNVLSFPSGLPILPIDDGLQVLGDIALCPGVVEAEAAAQGKPASAHWAHMMVHGVLHLCGMDHENAQDADIMESLETRILRQAGVPDPYTSLDETEIVSS